VTTRPQRLSSYAIAKQDIRDKCTRYLVANYWSAEVARETRDCLQPAGSLKGPTQQIWTLLGNQICLDCQCQCWDSQNWSMYCQSKKKLQNKFAHQWHCQVSFHRNNRILKICPLAHACADIENAVQTQYCTFNFLTSIITVIYIIQIKHVHKITYTIKTIKRSALLKTEVVQLGSYQVSSSMLLLHFKRLNEMQTNTSTNVLYSRPAVLKQQADSYCGQILLLATCKCTCCFCWLEDTVVGSWGCPTAGWSGVIPVTPGVEFTRPPAHKHEAHLSSHNPNVSTYLYPLCSTPLLQNWLP
jgi:hypothetical protein